MAKMTKAERERHYRELFADHQRSGLSLRAFARERGIPVGTLKYWKHELKRRDAAREQDQGNEAQFLPVKLVAPVEKTVATESYEVILREGFVFRMPRDFEVDRVAALLKAVSAC